MRHPVRSGPTSDAWLRHMRRAVDSLDLPAEHAETLWSYLERAAYFMVNTMDSPTSAIRPNPA